MNAAASIATGRLPDFIIIGAMKCATSTLHEQLARQAGVFMSTPKEPNFFSNDEQWKRGLPWYRDLFAGAKPGDVCGESSTHYSKRPIYPLTIERMRKHLPRELKLIYIMRDPIDRLVSQYVHEWTQRVVNGTIDEALETHPEMIAYSRYAMQLRPFLDVWGRANVMPLFFERFTSHPQEALERVCAFVGVCGGPKWVGEVGEQNVSSERLRQSPVRDAIANLPGMKALRRTLVPRSVRDSLKSAWKMKDRPTISESNLARLRGIFNDDLAALGPWLGADGLQCENFKEIAGSGHPSWRAQARAPAA